MAGGLVLILLVLAIVLVVIAIVRRTVSGSSSTPTDGHDVVAYLVLAVAMGVAGFALARLATSAFPSDGLVVDPAGDLSASLPALIVSSPFVVYFWRRQSTRRLEFPDSVGWGVYLTIIVLAFGTAFVVTGVISLDALLGDGRAQWPSVVVFGLLVGLHELAATQSPPRGDAGEIYRVAGSAIGLLTLGIGLIGTAGAALSAVFDSVFTGFSGSADWLPWTVMALLGTPIWVYYWLRGWDGEPRLPRQVWLIAVSAGTIVMTLFGFVGALAVGIEALVDEGTAGTDAVPYLIAAGVVGLATWLIHRRALGADRDNPVRTYEYLVAAVALASSVAAGVTLTQFAFGTRTLVGGDASDVLISAVWLVASVATWLWFHTRSNAGPTEEEMTEWPRRLYLLGVGVVMGLTAAIALIGGTCRHHPPRNRRCRRRVSTHTHHDICPGRRRGLVSVDALRAWPRVPRKRGSRGTIRRHDRVFTSGARRSDVSEAGQSQGRPQGRRAGSGHPETAETIIEMVGNRSSHVWVDDEGVRVAPLKTV